MGSANCCGSDNFDKKEKRQKKNKNLHISIEIKKVKEINDSYELNNNNFQYNNKIDVLTKGLKNDNNSCYINSFIQILFHCPLFLKKLTNEKSLVNYSDLIKYLIQFSEYYDEKYLEEIRKIMEKYYNDFQENKQCDSQDFGEKLIDRIIKEIKFQKDSYSKTSESSNINYLDKYFLEEIEMEKLFTLIECKNKYDSNYKNNSINFTYELQLNLSKNKNSKYDLEKLLNCKYNNLKIRKFPEILIITINRAKLNEKYNLKDIIYPYTLNMEKYSFENKKIKYKLFALNKKSGDSADEGHYFCNIKINETWYIFNDTIVEPKNPENTQGNIVGLFYFKDN